MFTGCARGCKFSRHAAQFLAFHTSQAEDDSEVQEAVLRFLACKNKRDSLLQIEEYANSSRGPPLTKGQTLLHVIARNGLVKTCKRVLSRRINGNDTYVVEVDIGG